MSQFLDSNSLQQVLLKGMVIVINARCSTVVGLVLKQVKSGGLLL